MEQEHKTNPSFLSSDIKLYIEQLDSESAEQDKTINEELNSAIRSMIKVATSSLEGFAQADASRVVTLVTQNGEDWAWFADDFYTREVIDNVPGMVSRFVRLSPVLVSVVPGRESATYLREASRCFVYGFFQAAIALCRAAIDAGLNHRLRTADSSVERKSLYDKINLAVQNIPQLLTPETASLAHDVRKVANDVLHDEPSEQRDRAFGIVVETRGVLKELYDK